MDSNFCTVRLDFVNTHRPTVGVLPRVHHRRLQALGPYIRGLVNDLTFFIEKQLIHSIHWFLPFCRVIPPGSVSFVGQFLSTSLLYSYLYNL